MLDFNATLDIVKNIVEGNLNFIIISFITLIFVEVWSYFRNINIIIRVGVLIIILILLLIISLFKGLIDINDKLKENQITIENNISKIEIKIENNISKIEQNLSKLEFNILKINDMNLDLKINFLEKNLLQANIEKYLIAKNYENDEIIMIKRMIDKQLKTLTKNNIIYLQNNPNYNNEVSINKITFDNREDFAIMTITYNNKELKNNICIFLKDKSYEIKFNETFYDSKIKSFKIEKREQKTIMRTVYANSNNNVPNVFENNKKYRLIFINNMIDSKKLLK